MPRPRLLAWSLLFGAALALRVYLSVAYPVIYSWDGFTRLWERDTLFVRHWLPLPQVPVVLLGDHLVPLKLAFALAGAGAALTLGLAVARLWGQRQGLIAGLLVAVLPGFVRFTVVPYQEGFLLLFVGLALLAWPDGLRDDLGRAAGWLGAAALALACACRYEAWMFAALVAASALWRRQWRALRLAAPALLTVVLWLATAPLRDPGQGPPRIYAFDSDPADDPVAALLRIDWAAVAALARLALTDWTWPGAVLVAWGMAVAVRRGGFAGRELLALWVGLVAVALARISVSGSMIDRQPILLVVLGLVYLAVGLVDLADRLSPGPRRALLVATTVLLGALNAARARHAVSESVAAWEPEVAAAAALRELPRSRTVLLAPRGVASIFGRSVVGAIFANAPELDPADARWRFLGKPGAEPAGEPDLVLYWWNGAYWLATPEEASARLPARATPLK